MITKQQAIAAINATKITRGCKMIAADVINEIEDSPVVVVTGCVDCPMLKTTRLYEATLLVCNHPNAPIIDATTYPELHATCPLKTNSLTIQLEQK